MIYQPACAREMWDTWLYFHQGTHYLFTLVKISGEVWDGISLSTSQDGVHYVDRGIIIKKRADAQWLGTGATWRVGDAFYLNFSEQRDGVQAIYFAQSDDLLNWGIVEDSACLPDPRWYDVSSEGRWDCIWPIQLSEDEYIGYLTAAPLAGDGLVCPSIGKVTSRDGVHWQAAPPPEFDWDGWPQMNVYEVGACESIGGLFHLMLGMGEERLGDRQRFTALGGQFGMYHFIAESPHGPFRPAKNSFRLLRSPNWMTYFARFYRAVGMPLVCHHACEKTGMPGPIWFAPLKLAEVHGEDLRLAWWSGNECLFGADIPLDFTNAAPLYRGKGVAIKQSPRDALMSDNLGGAILQAMETFDPGVGAALRFKACATPRAGRMGSIGAWFQNGAEKTAFLLETRGRTAIGSLSAQGSFISRDESPIGLSSGRWSEIIVLARHSLLEIYLDGLLVQCFSLNEPLTGAFGLVLESALAQVSELRLCALTAAPTP